MHFSDNGTIQGKKSSQDTAKYIFIISDCIVEEIFDDRKYTFLIREKKSDRSMILAAESSFTVYENWIRLLIHQRTKISVGAEGKPAKDGITERGKEGDGAEEEEMEEERSFHDSVSSEDFKSMRADIVADYFFQETISAKAEVSAMIFDMVVDMHLISYLSACIGHYESYCE